jgi:REP element-mobilizing transposase RayT
MRAAGDDRLILSRLGARHDCVAVTEPGLAPKRLIWRQCRLVPQTNKVTDMNTDEPLGFFITWTVYGTFLQGDKRWWRKTREGSQSPQPRLEQWHRDRLRHDVILLSDKHRESVESEIRSHCELRQWELWTVNARTNHVHVVVTAPGYAGDTVRDQLKANCTRGVRQLDERLIGRPVWTVRGDWESLNTDEDLEQAILYAGEGQDRKHVK